MDAEVVTGFYLVADIDFGGWIVADEHDSEPGRARACGERGDARLQFGFDFIADAVAVQD
jgi:hypothetical protein